MIDIHCHILPGMDDGAVDIEEALKMAHQACEDGITEIICTPHMHNGLHQLNRENVLAATLEFQKLLNDYKIPLHIHPGAEVHIHPLLLKNLDNSKLITLCQLNKYLLLEFPAISFPDYTKSLIRELIHEGIVPIIAHPERNSFFMENPAVLVEVIKLGAVTQINTGSLLGHMGNKIRKFTTELLKNQMVHVLASDGHNAKSRRPLLSEAYAEVSRLIGLEDVEILKGNAQAILKGENFKVPSPLYSKKHWICRWIL